MQGHGRTTRGHGCRAALPWALLALLLAAPAWQAPAAGAYPAHTPRASVQPPLPASDYAVRSVCAPVSAPSTASCLALQLVPITAAARAHTHLLGASAMPPPPQRPRGSRPAGAAAAGLFGLRPQDLHTAYALPSTPAAAPQQTIAIVDAYDDPHVESDLAVYDQEFDLPVCNAANRCFTKLNESGASAPLPAVEGEWSMEIALDVETAHAVCVQCRIVLVEADSSAYTDLEAAERRAEELGATEISNSWGGEEPVSDSDAFNDPGVAITAASGDYGYRNWDDREAPGGFTNYPASSPHVVAVGGTRLNITSSGAWASEQVWNGQGATGGGCSARFPAPSWQRAVADWASVGCETKRAVADVAADADPYTGVAVYDSTPEQGASSGPGWLTLGGTSLATPIVAATFALAGGVHSTSGYGAQSLYAAALSDPASLHAIEVGSNGECTRPFTLEGLSGCTALEEAASCSVQAICLAGPGYNGPAGVGTPDGICAFAAASTCSGSEPNGSSNSGASARGSSPGEQSTPSRSAQTGAPEQSSPGTLSGSGGPPPDVRAAAVRLLGLSLSVRALSALRGTGRHGPLLVSELAFRFVLTRADHVRVTLERLARGGGGRSRAIGTVLVLRARAGANRARLHGGAQLAPGRYRLTLSPADGRARSLVLTVS